MTVFDDSFNGTAPPAGPPILVGSSPSGVSYSNFNSGTYAQGSGEALIQSSNDGYVGFSLGAGPNYGKPVFGQFTTLQTGTSYNTSDSTDGLRSGQSFTVNGLFDPGTFSDTTNRYGIVCRIGSRARPTLPTTSREPKSSTSASSSLPAAAGGDRQSVLSELNYETGVSDNLQVVTIPTLPSGDFIELSLSNDAANNGVISFGVLPAGES